MVAMATCLFPLFFLKEDGHHMASIATEDMALPLTGGTEGTMTQDLTTKGEEGDIMEVVVVAGEEEGEEDKVSLINEATNSCFTTISRLWFKIRSNEIKLQSWRLLPSIQSMNVTCVQCECMRGDDLAVSI